MADSACDHSLARASLSRGPPFFFSDNALIRLSDTSVREFPVPVALGDAEADSSVWPRPGKSQLASPEGVTASDLVPLVRSADTALMGKGHSEHRTMEGIAMCSPASLDFGDTSKAVEGAGGEGDAPPSLSVTPSNNMQIGEGANGSLPRGELMLLVPAQAVETTTNHAASGFQASFSDFASIAVRGGCWLTVFSLFFTLFLLG